MSLLYVCVYMRLTFIGGNVIEFGLLHTLQSMLHFASTFDGLRCLDIRICIIREPFIRNDAHTFFVLILSFKIKRFHQYQPSGFDDHTGRCPLYYSNQYMPQKTREVFFREDVNNVLCSFCEAPHLPTVMILIDLVKRQFFVDKMR